MEINDLSPWLLLVAPVIIVIGYTVFGLSGFGSTVISVPVLAHFLPVSYLVPLMALLDLASACLVGTASREHISRPEMKRIIPWMFVGFVVGVTLLKGVPDDYLRTALGTFSAWWSVPAWIVGGAIATIFGAAGPIYSTYLAGRLKDKSEIRATISA